MRLVALAQPPHFLVSYSNKCIILKVSISWFAGKEVPPQWSIYTWGRDHYGGFEVIRRFLLSGRSASLLVFVFNVVHNHPCSLSTLGETLGIWKYQCTAFGSGFFGVWLFIFFAFFPYGWEFGGAFYWF